MNNQVIVGKYAAARVHCMEFRLQAALALCAAILLSLFGSSPARAANQSWDTMSDTWAATDALERSLPVSPQVSAPRTDRFVALFYFLWLGPHVNGGPYDINKILAQDPLAMQKKDSPLWGPMHVPHHWGESYLGYYLTHDPFVLKKHAQMIADAGVDVIIFDCSNQITYQTNYLALCKAFTEVRQNGGKTPQIAFLCPFGDPAKVVNELYRNLYAPKLYPDLWFRWEGKPLILADPDRVSNNDAEVVSKNELPVALNPEHTLGQSFSVARPFDSIAGNFPTWNTTTSALTLTMYRDNAKGERVATQQFERVADNAWLTLATTNAWPAGNYYLEASLPKGKIGWWKQTKDRFPRGEAFADGAAATGDFSLRIDYHQPGMEPIQRFFTFRKPQPDYFQGPTGPNQWSWLEVYPQHVFKNSAGQKEQMSVGVGQNAVTNRLGSMSEHQARGRSYHYGQTVSLAPSGGEGDRKALTPALGEGGAIARGLNVAEQWDRAIQEDPQVIFITGWNEWIASRFDEFGGVRLPVMFVDQFDQEHSRDIEPMKGGHGDAYYYQMIANIRRYKGTRPLPKAGPAKTIRLDAGFDQWNAITPEYRDDIGDTVHRDFPGYNQCAQYTNTSGRNDFVALKVSRDAQYVYFYAQTREPLTSYTDGRWMMLLLDVDQNHKTGWEGYDFIINRRVASDSRTTLERNKGGWNWEKAAEIRYAAKGNQLHIAIPRTALGLAKGPLKFDFKWADNVPEDGKIIQFIDQGDAAPNGRFNYRYEE